MDRRVLPPGRIAWLSFREVTDARICRARTGFARSSFEPELHRQAATTLIGALREHELLARELAARSAALERAGYHAQVKVSDEGSLLFRIVDVQRLPLRRKNGGFAAGGNQQSFDETLREVEQHPEQFSPSALLRPVVQDALLPTVACIGGPAGNRLPYAQASVVYKKRSGEKLRRFCRDPRSQMVTAHVANLLKKYSADYERRIRWACASSARG